MKTKIAIALLSLQAVFVSGANAEIIRQDHPVASNALAQAMWNAYARTAHPALNAQGEYEFTIGYGSLKCTRAQGRIYPAVRCWLLAGQWSQAGQGVGSILFTPVREEAVIELFEYMRVPSKEHQDSQSFARTKTLQEAEGPLYYTLHCGQITSKVTGQIQWANCNYINGASTR